MPSKKPKKTTPDEGAQPRVRIANKKHPHAGKQGWLTGESQRPPGGGHPMMKVVWREGGQDGCFVDQVDLVYLDLPGQDQPERKLPTTREARRALEKKTKPRVTNGGKVGNLLQNGEVAEPLAESASGRKRREPEQICGAEGKRGGGPCRHPAGFRTDHPGSGRCWLHGGRTPAPTGRYASVRRPRVQELLAEYEADPDPLNLTGEVMLLRSLLHDYIERFDEQDQMLTRWNLSFEKAFQSDWTSWWRDIRADALEAGNDDLNQKLLDDMPDPMEYLPSKPLRMADITEVSGLIKEVGAMVERIRKAQTQHTFTMDTVNLLWKVMGGHITDAALEVISDDDLRNAYLTSVEQRFATISLAELASRRPAD